MAMALRGKYAVIGHSLGGVLLREVLLGDSEHFSPPTHLFLVGSPIQATKLNQSLSQFFMYKLLFGQCGALVASPERMRGIGIVDVPTTCIVGGSGDISHSRNNSDGMVLESELCTDLFEDVVRIKSYHPFMAANPRLSEIVVERIGVRNTC